MIGKVDNGRRVMVETASYSGKVGMDVLDGAPRVAFVPNRGQPAIGDRVTIDGDEAYEIAALGYGQHATAMRIVTLREVAK